MLKYYWYTEEFKTEFYKYSELVLPPVFKSQIEKVRIIVEHWNICHPCQLGFDISEYSGTFEDVFLKIAATPIDHHICNGDYKLSNLIYYTKN